MYVKVDLRPLLVWFVCPDVPPCLFLFRLCALRRVSCLSPHAGTASNTHNKAVPRPSSMTVKFISAVLHGSKRQHLQVLQSQHAEQSSTKYDRRETITEKEKIKVRFFLVVFSIFVKWSTLEGESK